MGQISNPESPGFNIGSAVYYKGDFDIDRFKKAVQDVADRTDALRLVVDQSSNRPEQKLLRSLVAPVHVVDYTYAPDSENRTEQKIRELINEPFLFNGSPLWKCVIFVLGDAEYCWFSCFHHLIVDGTGLSMFCRLVCDFYNDETGGLLDQSFPSFVEQVEKALDYKGSQRQERDRRYWRERFSVMPPSLLPGAKPRAEGNEQVGDVITLKIARSLKDKISSCAADRGCTLVHFLLALLASLFSRGRNVDDIVVGLAVHNRSTDTQKRTIGMFASVLPVRIAVDNESSFSDLMNQVASEVKRAYRHKTMSIDEIARSIKNVDREHAQIFDLSFSLDDFPAEEKFIGDTLPVARKVFHDHEAWPLSVWLTDYQKSTEPAFSFSYNRSSLSDDEARHIVDQFQEMLHGVIEGGVDSPVHRLPIMNEAQRRIVVEGFNDTQADYPKEALIHELFEQQVQKTPEAVAVAYEGESLSYAELNAKANQLAHRLRGLGVEPDTRVAICVQRSLEMVVGLLGILKAGGAYVPVDPEYPEDRIAYILRDAGAPILLTQAHLQALLPASDAQVLLLDDQALYADQPVQNIDKAETGQNSANLAYVIYTSGSTGMPKGVMNEHRGVVNRLCWNPQGLSPQPDDRVLHKTAFSFDVSVWEIFWTLARGACMVMARPGGQRDPAYLKDLVEAERITMLDFVPSMLQSFIEHVHSGECASVRQVLCGGEEVSPGLLASCAQKLPQAQLNNLYGPTEAAVDATRWVFEADKVDARVPIGKPIANTRIYILDEQGQPVPIGVSGEIHIAGDGVARGYLNRPELTEEKFIPDPFSDTPGARMYKTGDLGKWRSDGAIEYLGRNDFQVKIRGLRIELGEIEARLAQLPAVREAVVVAREACQGDKRLVAYWTVREGVDDAQLPDVEQLRDHLKTELPGYMVPSAFVKLEAMPLTPNGKVDRNALPAPEGDAFAVQAYEPPQGQTEEVLAAIWQELLGVERVGRHDNFFDLGGHSLLIVSLQSRIRKLLSQDVDLNYLIQNQSIAQQTEHFYTKSKLVNGLIQMRTGTTERPVFIVHEVTGDVLSYTDVANSFSREYPVYGITALGLNKEERKLDSFESMASCYIGIMKSVAKQGPYRLIGWSAGGMLAWEIARQLTINGEQVEFIGMIDTHYGNLSEADDVEDNIRLIELLNGVHGGLDDSTIKHLQQIDNLDSLIDETRKTGILNIEASNKSVKDRLSVARSMESLFLGYAVRGLPVRAHLFGAEDGEAAKSWEEFKGDPRPLTVPIGGTHWSIVRKPHANRMVAIIESILKSKRST